MGIGKSCCPGNRFSIYNPCRHPITGIGNCSEYYIFTRFNQRAAVNTGTIYRRTETAVFRSAEGYRIFIFWTRRILCKGKGLGMGYAAAVFQFRPDEFYPIGIQGR